MKNGKWSSSPTRRTKPWREILRDPIDRIFEAELSTFVKLDDGREYPFTQNYVLGEAKLSIYAEYVLGQKIGRERFRINSCHFEQVRRLISIVTDPNYGGIYESWVEQLREIE